MRTPDFLSLPWGPQTPLSYVGTLDFLSAYLEIDSLWEGGSGWGIHVYPTLIHVNVWQKPLQYCKVISFQLIKK